MLAAALSAATPARGAELVKATLAAKEQAVSRWGYPLGRAGQVPGDGFWLRHGFTVENTWYLPGYWHTGEDWYALSGDTAGASVYAVSDGVVVYAGANYPGRVVIVKHESALFSMYGHLDPRLSVKVGQRVAQGALLGTVLKRSDKVPNHLHFELRTFLTTRLVNGAAPRYNFRCGRQCPPGPGYWPMDAPELPAAMGWLNPTHVIAGRAAIRAQNAAKAPRTEVVVATEPAAATAPVRSAPSAPRWRLGHVRLQPGQRFPVLAAQVGAPAAAAAGAQAYEVWYKIELVDGKAGWVQAIVPDTAETGHAGTPASLRFNFLPASE